MDAEQAIALVLFLGIGVSVLTGNKEDTWTKTAQEPSSLVEDNVLYPELTYQTYQEPVVSPYAGFYWFQKAREIFPTADIRVGPES